MIRPIVLHSGQVEETRALGLRLAEVLGVPFRLLDEGMGKAVGVEVAAGHIVGLSSEGLLDRARRIEVLKEAFVIRVGRDANGGRLLAEGVHCDDGVRVRLGELLGKELDEAHATVELPIGSPEAEVARLVRLLKRNPVCVAALEESYLVEVGRGILEAVVAEMEARSPVSLYVTDETVERLHGGRLRAAVELLGTRVVGTVLPPGEETKCLGTLAGLFEAALQGGLDRSGWVVAAGGGVITDISGLAAALWMRGVRWMGIPTTLLAMVDASVGGKTAVDFGVGKNAVGAFWQPSKVVCDVEFLATESERNYIGALSEVVKTAVIGDAELFELLEREVVRVKARDLDLMGEVVRRCVAVKARVVGLDARESGLRATLNLGHTVGHALEALGEYRRYTHGEAVSLGLVAALRLGQRWGRTPGALVERIEGLLERLGLPVKLPLSELPDAAELLGHDKKRAGSRLKFVFAEAIGDVRVGPMMLEELREGVAELACQ